ncbi:MAG: SH3 domain-containing protein [Bacteroidia bacterium]|nr:SH3 domain-containing protein [Bacteroidia bacterium]
MRLPAISLFLLLFLCSFSPDNQLSSLKIVISEDPIHLYVFAPNGLNMREGPEVSHNKLTKIPYGAKVELISPPGKKELVVDGLKGGMAKVSYGGFTGYAFDGYMSKYQAPSLNMEIRKYVDELRKDGHVVYYEKTERDYDGYFQYEESILLFDYSWQEGFLVAKQLCRIPQKLYFPPASDKDEEKFENPEKAEYAWSDELSVKREKGKITEISYYYRGEGGGHSVTIKEDNEGHNALRITDLGIAD